MDDALQGLNRNVEKLSTELEAANHKIRQFENELAPKEIVKAGK